MFVNMKTTYRVYAILVALAGQTKASASRTMQPVEVYMSDGVEIPYVAGPSPQPPGSTPISSTTSSTGSVQVVPFSNSTAAPVPSSTPSVTPSPSITASVSSSVAQEDKAYKPSQSNAQTISHTAVAVVSQAISSEAAEANTLPSATLAASQITAAPVIDVAGAGVMTIAITNKWDTPLSISYLNNADSPSAIGAPQEAPLGTTTTVVYPTGWAGRIYIGKTINSADSKIEGSTTGANDIDISYVDGFSVPITCSVGKTPIVGCNIDLWAVNGACANQAGGERNVCLNSMQGVANGPADPWFLPCQGAAYTFPNDNVANNGDTGTPNISCCIGTAEQGCAAPARQGHGNNQASKAKRSISEDLVAGAPSLLPRAHSHLKRHLAKAKQHRRAVARDIKEMV